MAHKGKILGESLKNTKQQLKTFLSEKVNLRFVAAAPFLLCTPAPASSDLENCLYERGKV